MLTQEAIELVCKTASRWTYQEGIRQSKFPITQRNQGLLEETQVGGGPGHDSVQQRRVEKPKNISDGAKTFGFRI